MGVFATRSPFRPSPIGLSAVKLLGIECHLELGPVLRVSGADLMDGTPILDIKPYLPYGDCIPEASGGFTDRRIKALLTVKIPDELLNRVPEERRAALRGVLANDPRPPYHSDPTRIYGMKFAGMEVRFSVSDGILLVQDIIVGAKER